MGKLCTKHSTKHFHKYFVFVTRLRSRYFSQLIFLLLYLSLLPTSIVHLVGTKSWVQRMTGHYPCPQAQGVGRERPAAGGRALPRRLLWTAHPVCGWHENAHVTCSSEYLMSPWILPTYTHFNSNVYVSPNDPHEASFNNPKFSVLQLSLLLPIP